MTLTFIWITPLSLNYCYIGIGWAKDDNIIIKHGEVPLQVDSNVHEHRIILIPLRKPIQTRKSLEFTIQFIT